MLSGMMPTTRVGFIVESDARIEDVLAPAEVRSPRPVAEDRDLPESPPRQSSGLKRAASQRARAEAVEELRQHDSAVQAGQGSDTAA